jgi:hypothetical protein
MAHWVLSPGKPAMLTPLKLLNAMMLGSPLVLPISPLVASPAAMPQFPLPSGAPLMSVPILFP